MRSASRRVVHVQQRLFGRAETVYSRSGDRLHSIITLRVTGVEAEKICLLAKKKNLTVSELSRKILVASASRLLK